MDTTCTLCWLKDFCGIAANKTKPKEINIEYVVNLVWKFVTTMGSNALIKYHGNQVVNGERYWYMEIVDCVALPFDARAWFTSNQCLAPNSNTKPMTDIEYFKCFSSGKCTFFTYTMVNVLWQLMNQDVTLQIDNEPVTEVFTVDVTMKINYEKQDHCFRPEKDEDHYNSKPDPIKWSRDYLARDRHNLIGLSTKSNKHFYILDLSHFQYGFTDLNTKKLPMKIIQVPYPRILNLDPESGEMVYRFANHPVPGYGIIDQIVTGQIDFGQELEKFKALNSAKEVTVLKMILIASKWIMNKLY
jgi:hypothetical protein